jgi:hypothetical protein
MTNQPAESLVDLARSWNSPPEIKVIGGAKAEGYDYTQRAYVLNAQEGVADLDLEIAANEESPLFNLILVANNWSGNNAVLKLNGNEIPPGKDFRFGLEYDVEGNRKLIVFAKVKSRKATKVTLSTID